MVVKSWRSIYLAIVVLNVEVWYRIDLYVEYALKLALVTVAIVLDLVLDRYPRPLYALYAVAEVLAVQYLKIGCYDVAILIEQRNLDARATVVRLHVLQLDIEVAALADVVMYWRIPRRVTMDCYAVLDGLVRQTACRSAIDGSELVIPPLGLIYCHIPCRYAQDAIIYLVYRAGLIQECIVRRCLDVCIRDASRRSLDSYGHRECLALADIRWRCRYFLDDWVIPDFYRNDVALVIRETQILAQRPRIEIRRLCRRSYLRCNRSLASCYLDVVRHVGVTLTVVLLIPDVGVLIRRTCYVQLDDLCSLLWLTYVHV